MPSEPSCRAAGYAALIERYQIQGAAPWHQSLVCDGAAKRIESSATGETETYPAQYWPGDDPCDHLEFALKYDGTDLALLAKVLPAIGPGPIVQWVQATPQGKYTRRIWYLFELLTGERLPLADMTAGNYVDLLEPAEYFVLERPTQVRRQRINDNLLGTGDFCPSVRRTAAISSFIDRDLSARSRELMSGYSPDLLKRAMGYLYTKETKSSFEIERITPDVSRTERFVALLHVATRDDLCTKPRLVEIQNQIVDPRFRETGYRTDQNYVGETVHFGNERIHYVCPGPELVEGLMSGVVAAHRRMEASGVHPVLHAALVGYGFVFVHPFGDGNGRIHRLLIHNILARRGFVPSGMVFPVSAVMLKRPAEYDASLEAFSKPIMQLADYELDDSGRMKVRNGGVLAPLYRYPDMTAQVEALFEFIRQTVETELAEELSFLANYDRTKRAMQEVVDLPDRDLDLFMRLCLQNHGKLSKAKRESTFRALRDDEIERLERCVTDGYRSVGTDRAADD
jgi:hypothetical protein